VMPRSVIELFTCWIGSFNRNQNKLILTNVPLSASCKLVQGLHADGGGGIMGKEFDSVQSSFVREMVVEVCQ
jgi:hypothetical protein